MNEINSAPAFGPSFTKRELAAALAMYPIAYIYTLLFSANSEIWFGMFVLLFVLLVEYINCGRPAPTESWVWLGCVAVITLCVVFGWGQVWYMEYSILFVHAIAVWWALSRSGALLDGETGHLFPADVFNGFIRLPFGGFFKRALCLRHGLGRLRRDKDGAKASAIPAALLALAAAALLLYIITTSLAAADSGFNSIMADIIAFFTPKDPYRFSEFLLRFVLSLPVGAWLFGLIYGSANAQRESLDGEAGKLNTALLKLRKVHVNVWIFCASAFAIVYLIFFVVQGSYLFGAFTRSLPEGFTVAEYARQGFFELCRVMALNFVLLWLMTRTGTVSAKESRLMRLMCSLLLAAGMLFAVVAISKLGLYISCFGFTPKRLQSTWLALVLLSGCAGSMYSLWTGKKSFRAWLMFGGVTLALLHLF